jgi:hypothetical protein
MVTAISGAWRHRLPCCRICRSSTSWCLRLIHGWEERDAEWRWVYSDAARSADCEAILALVVLAAVGGRAGSSLVAVYRYYHSLLGVNFHSCFQRTDLCSGDVKYVNGSRLPPWLNFLARRNLAEPERGKASDHRRRCNPDTTLQLQLENGERNLLFVKGMSPRLLLPGKGFWGMAT